MDGRRSQVLMCRNGVVVAREFTSPTFLGVIKRTQIDEGAANGCSSAFRNTAGTNGVVPSGQPDLRVADDLLRFVLLERESRMLGRGLFVNRRSERPLVSATRR